MCAVFVLSVPNLGCQNPIFRGAVALLALANAGIGLLLHYANALPAQGKGAFGSAERLVGL